MCQAPMLSSDRPKAIQRNKGHFDRGMARSKSEFRSVGMNSRTDSCCRTRRTSNRNNVYHILSTTLSHSYHYFVIQVVVLVWRVLSLLHSSQEDPKMVEIQ